MAKRSTKWMLPLALLVISSMLLAACGADATATTAPAAAPTDTVAAPAAAPTDTVAAPAAAPTDTTAAAAQRLQPRAAAQRGSKFDPSTLQEERRRAEVPLARLQLGRHLGAAVNSDALARFNQVYPDVKITYEPQPS